MQLIFEFNLFVEKVSNRTLFAKRDNQEGFPIMYHIRITAQFESRQRTQGQDQIKQIKYLWSHRYMHALGSISAA